MNSKIQIAAVGDILMWRRQIQSARQIEKNKYTFTSMFQEVVPLLQEADLTIGNLETTLSGREKEYQQKSVKTGYPMFNCPDELADTLKNIGFDVLTTANNHAMDRGIKGLKRTLDVLDKHQLLHTGTARTFAESKRHLIINVKGIRVGVLSYTYGTNFHQVPKDSIWAVQRIHSAKIIQDLRQLRKSADLIITVFHFGSEFKRQPNERQKYLTRLAFLHGADIVLGVHPHVLQPMSMQRIKDIYGIEKNRFVIYSLGNFISDKMFGNLHADCGVIVKMEIVKNRKGVTEVKNVQITPTWVHKYVKNNRLQFRVLPVQKFIIHPDEWLTNQDKQILRKVYRNTTQHLRMR